jgi:hypothetical protein
LFQRREQIFGQAGLTVALSLDQRIAQPLPFGRFGPRADALRERLATIDWVPDLGLDIGSLHWFRGLATCALLCTATVMMAPGFRPIRLG